MPYGKGRKGMKALHIIGGLAMICAVGFAEGGQVPLLNCLALGMSGGALMIATMKMTGWYE